MSGYHIEITNAEAVALGHCTEAMRKEIRHMEPGWFARYVRAHREAMKILRTVFERLPSYDFELKSDA